jgi:putative oxidoreductase
MKQILNKDTGILLLRVGFGIIFIMHGYPKLLGGVEKWTGLGNMVGFSFLPAFWGFMAAFSEGIGGLMLALGACTRTASTLLALTMVGAITFHISSAQGSPMHAIESLIIFISFILMGGGKYSIDSYIGCKCCKGE